MHGGGAEAPRGGSLWLWALSFCWALVLCRLSWAGRRIPGWQGSFSSVLRQELVYKGLQRVKPHRSYKGRVCLSGERLSPTEGKEDFVRVQYGNKHGSILLLLFCPLHSPILIRSRKGFGIPAGMRSFRVSMTTESELSLQMVLCPPSIPSP